MDKRGKVVISVLILFIVLVSLSSYFAIAASAENTKSYDSLTRTVTLKNGVTEIAKIKLDTPLVYNVIRGKDRLVAEFTIDNYIDGYSDVFNDIGFYDIKNNMNKISRPFSYKYKTSYNVEVPDYETVCKERLSLNESIEKYDCVQNQIGRHIEERVKWNDFDEKVILPKGKITIGIFTDVLPDERVEWIPTLYGIRIEEWASWNETFNNGLIGYWGLDEGTGLNAKESRFGINNLTTYSNTNRTTSAINNYALYFSGNDANARASSTTAYNMEKYENRSIVFWMNASSLGGSRAILGKPGVGFTNSGWVISEETATLSFYIVTSWGPSGTVLVNFANVLVANGQYQMYVVVYNGTGS